MAINRNITVYQGTTYQETFFLTEGVRSEIASITTGTPTTITTKTPHLLATNDYVYFSRAESSPSLIDAFQVTAVPSSTTFEIGTSINTVRSIKGATVARTINISAYTFKGQIKQKRVKALGNALATVESGSRDVLVQGGADVDSGDFITLSGAGFTDSKILRVARSGTSSVLTMATSATGNVSKQPIESAIKVLAEFNFSISNGVGGKVSASIPATDTEIIPISYDRDTYFYDIKYKTGTVIKPLVYGKVTVTPQVTPTF